MIKKRRIAIFDVDGTLSEGKKVCRLIVKILLRSDFIFFLYQLYFKKLARSRSGLMKRFNSLIYKILERLDTKEPELIIGAREFLEELAKNQVKMFVTTAGSESLKTKQKLQKLGIANFFEKILGREVSKEEAVIAFAKHLGIEYGNFCEEAFLVSDGLEDMLLAQRLGIYGIRITTLYYKMLKENGAKKVVNSFEELIRLYKQPPRKKTTKKARQTIT